jgi:hypothetical protein
MTSNSQDGRCPEEHEEKLKFEQRMEGGIQITSKWHTLGLCGHSIYHTFRKALNIKRNSHAGQYPIFV